MKNITKPTKIQNKAVVIAHKIMLVVMLHSSFIAPSQSLISAYINRVSPLHYLGSSLPNYNTSLNENQTKLIDKPYKQENTVNKASDAINNTSPQLDSNNTVIPFDIQHGIIGVSIQNPLDDPKDNLFKFSLITQPESKKRYFLSYELYGVQDNSAVSRSINNRFATGGYLVKQQQSWSSQKEELNPMWLRKGTNKIMFSIPKGAEYQYEVRNIKIEVQEVKENAVLPLVVLNSLNTTYIKDNKMYVKGFLRSAITATAKVYIEDQPLILNGDEFEGFITLTPALKNRKFLVVKAIDSNGLLGQEIVPFDTLNEADSLFSIEPISNRAAKIFGAAISGELEGDGASLVIKENSLSETKEISITKIRNIDIAPLSSGMINVTKGGLGYRFLPDGTTFKIPVLLKIAYDEKLLPKGYAVKDIKTFYFNTDSKSWVAVKRDTINEKEKTVSVLTTHFTDYINGIIQAPESPETAGFTSTMMNDIKAADPSSEMTIISPPEVSQKGDANVSYPIKIPAGRKGMQPQIALQYSSGGGNGWLGEGWNINIPSVSLDTRWGVPTFDPINESEIYSLGGEQMMYPKLGDSDWMPNRHTEVGGVFSTLPRTRIAATEAIFTPRKQGSYAKIERLGTSPSTYYWKVTNTDGSKNWYGGDAKGIKENTIIRKTQNPLANNPESTPMANGSEIVHWGLYMSEDVYGNNVIYEYRNESTRQFLETNENLNGGNIFHIKTIFYTGFKSSKGSYSIIFEEDSNVRNDVSINANLGLKQIEPFVLKKVTVKNRETIIRRYGFTYVNGKFEKTLLDKVTEFDTNNTEFYSHKFKYYDDVELNGGYFSNNQSATICYETQPRPDADGDSVCDSEDACPLVFGLASNSGCPIAPLNKVTSQNYSESLSNSNNKFTDYYKRLRERYIIKAANFDVSNKGDDCTNVTSSDSFSPPNIPGFNNSGAILGSSVSKNFNAAGFFGFGFDFTWNPFNKNLTFGMQYTHGWDLGESLTTLIDINGDGLDDVVYKTGGRLYWKKHTLVRSYDTQNLPVLTHSFESYQPITSVNNDISDFYISRGESTSMNFQLNIDFGASAIFGYDNSHNYSRSTIYFSDANGDGLIDIIKDGVAYFNRIDSSTGNPYFETESLRTENMLISAEPITVTPPVISTVVEDKVPNYDVVKMWEAPANGPIEIENTIVNNDPLKEVIITIEMKDNGGQSLESFTCNYAPGGTGMLYGKKLNRTLPNVNSIVNRNATNTSALIVKKGDRIYFRVHCIATGNPSVSWNPKIKYLDNQLLNTVDANGQYLYTNKYSDGFILSQQNPVIFPGKQGSVAITWTPITVNNPSDSVTYEIIKKTFDTSNPNLNSEVTIWSAVCNANQNSIVTAPTSLSNYVIPLSNSTTTIFLFKVKSSSNLDWKAIEWKSKMQCTVSNQEVTGGGSVTTVETKYPIPDYSIYKSYICASSYKTFDGTNLQGATINPNVSLFNSNIHDNGIVYFVVKKAGHLFGKKTITVTNGVATSVGSPIIIDGVNNANIEIGYYTDDSKRTIGDVNDVSLLTRVLSSSNAVSFISTQGGIRILGGSQINLLQKPNSIYGSMYRQWGQFMYNPKATTKANHNNEFNIDLLKEELLVIGTNQANAIYENLYTTPVSNPPVLNPAITNLQNLGAGSPAFQQQIGALQAQFNATVQDPFMVANAHRDFDIPTNSFDDKWIAMHQENYANETNSRAAKLSQTYTIESQGAPTTTQASLVTGAYGIDRISEGSSETYCAGGNIGGVGASGNYSPNGINNSLTDFIDLNGDRYPDVVTNDEIQLTKKTGGLFPVVSRNNGGSISEDNSKNWGLSASGSFNSAGKLQKPGTGHSSLGLSGSYSNVSSNSSRIFTDINSDGLPDILTKTSTENASPVTVSLNLGNNNFSGPLSWGEFNLANGKSENIGGGIGFNYSNASAEAGLNLGRTDAGINNTLIDINGDGMIDQIDSYSGNLSIRVNNGNKFARTPINIPIFDYNNNSSTSTAGLNGTYTYGFIVPLYLIFFVIPIKVSDIGITVSGSTSTTRTKKSISDFDGDGFPDLIEEASNNTIKVYSSNIRRTNKLKAVTNPLGGSFTIDYTVQPIDYNNPHPKWAMSSVSIYDGYDKVNDGNDTYKKEYKYENGKYDRRERDFYGYETVSTLDYREGNSEAPYRTSISKYHNESYFLNGLLKESYMMKGNDENQKYSKTSNFYEVRQLSSNNQAMSGIVLSNLFDVGGTEGRKSAAVVMTKTISELYELAPSPQITTQVEMQYDSKGRVINYSNLGNTALTNDNYSATIAYHDLAINVPKEINVLVNGTTVRRRTTEVDSNTGSQLEITAFNNDEISQTSLKYDEFGNVVHVEHPANAAGERMYYDYAYDELYHKYVTNIKDAFGYSSSAVYNSNFDKVIETVALTGNKMHYDYDTFGRNTIIIAPKELDAGIKYTIKFDYYPYFSLLRATSGVTEDTFVPVAVTSHYDQQHPGNDIQTYTFIDGLARPIQIKKDITLNKSEDHKEEQFYEALSISGKTYFDEFGRATQQFHPYFETKTDATKFLLNEYASPYSATTQFDELDRPIKTIDPEDNISTVEYSIDSDNTGEVALKTKSTTDQNENQSIVTETYKNVSGKVISTMNLGATALWTNFNYDAIGQLMNYKDAQGFVTDYKYDLLGRKIFVNHPDNGTTTFKYDTASNLVQLQTANLAAAGTFVNYNYQYNRLQEIVYPETPSGQNLSNVNYKYGDSGNNAGQLIYQSDATGHQEFEYGNMGEVVTNVRTVISPNLPSRVFKTNYFYDSWNRLQTMIYPDQEKVNYNYDLGGNLTRMTGQVYGRDYQYINRIDYDYYEQRAYLLYGNKTETFYNYTPALRRLENLNVKTSNAQDLYNNFYKYDKVGNVTNLVNQAGPTENSMGGNYGHGFEYDNLNRLVNAKGYFEGNQVQQREYNNDFQSDYNIKMEYNATHGIENKTQMHYKNSDATPVAANTYSNTYKYQDHTHKVVHIDDSMTGATEDFKYDLNGNLIYKTNTDGSDRSLYWDESNRLRVVNDPAGMQHYIYDASGERILKANSNIEAVYGNGSLLVPASTTINSYTTYPSANLVIDANGIYSKHYYAGTQRIVSRIGEKSIRIFDVELPCENCMKMQELQKTNLQQILTKGKLGQATFKPYQPYTYEEAQKALAEEDSIVKRPIFEAERIPPLYFYHPDHLGTSTFLTDYNGNAYQFFLNLPFGETMAEQLGSNYYNTPYKFNGKELDEETGLYYYGARYYDPRVSIWLSVDPMAEKFPNSSPYNYCLGNPINLIDPDGRYPFPILIYNSKLGMYGGYNFTQSASHLLSLVSGVSERTIQNVTIQERAPGQYRPFYSASSGGGGITLGLNSDQANITYTENYFEDNQNAYDGHGYGQDIKAWLDISAHEVGHLPQIDKEGSLTSYLGEFIKQYAGAAGHNGASYEKDAEKGTTEFRNFNKFVDKTYGKDALINVMKATEKTDGYKGSELYKIKKIDKFWKEYEKSAKKME